MKLLPYLIFLIAISLNACISKKYGRHFNNQFNYSSVAEVDLSLVNDQILSVSANEDLKLHEETDQKNQSLQVQDQTEVFNTDPNGQLNKLSVYKKSKEDIRRIEEKGDTSARKTEPIGLASFGLFLLTVLLVLAEGAVGLSTGLAAIFILATMIGGGISHYRIKKDPKKWKGRFFGMFTIIAGLLFLLLLGFAAFIESVFGST
ncbi:MAG: hypothetical protein ABJF04_04200 [Reichenbachiella sp.]|uniref:hypothetical protein n=1 Tax=Reichenbachiella sp. TaxID=2184521 RepID=UPI0032666F62